MKISGCLIALIFGWLAYASGLLYNFMILFVMISALLSVLTWGIATWRGKCENSFLLQFFDTRFRFHRFEFLLKGLFLILLGAALDRSIVVAQFTPEKYLQARELVWSSILIVFFFSFFPLKNISRASNLFWGLGAALLLLENFALLAASRASHAVLLDSPFHQECLIFNGGPTPLLNHHFGIPSQRHALDITIARNGLILQGPPKDFSSYPAWDQLLYAPEAGTVKRVIQDRPDQSLGTADSKAIEGNCVVIQIADQRYLMMAHLRQGSVLVKEGDSVNRGQPIARCGNSGNTSDPHLHLQVQNVVDFQEENCETYPIFFRAMKRTRYEKTELLEAADLRRNDLVSPATRASP